MHGESIQTGQERTRTQEEEETQEGLEQQRGEGTDSEITGRGTPQERVERENEWHSRG